MSFIENLRRARQALAQEERLSLRALGLELGLEDAALEPLVDELVDVQRVARREGNALVWAGATVPQGASARAEASRPPFASAERRQLTVVFCDLVDSTALASGFDPEDWREIVGRYQQAVGDVVETFEGSVAQYLGDGVLVYFGYPFAHEDDAERAVRAGLTILQRMDELNEKLRGAHGIALTLRIGVHTGPAVVGEVGDVRHREVLALGTTTNLAARLLDIAAPDALVLSGETLRLVPGIFVTADLGAHELRGIPRPIRVFRAERATGVRSRIGVLRGSALTPLVGRDHELGVLAERWAAVQEGMGQGVLVGGEAGLGKSRLVEGFRERIAEDAHTWLECHCTPYTQGTALFPVIELQEQGLGISPDDLGDKKLGQIEAALAASELGTERNVQLLASLHDVPTEQKTPLRNLSPEGQRRQTLDLLCEWLLRLGRSQPLVLLMEDLHWMDPTSVELLAKVFDQLPTSNLLVLATHRPEFQAPWQPRAHLTPLQLPRLTRAQMGELVQASPEAGTLPREWVEEIVRRSDGVPLYGEELARASVQRAGDAERGAASPTRAIPETLQDSLMGRLDRLGPVKAVAQLGAVLGREFSYELMREVSPLEEAALEAALAHATDEDLFYQRGAPPEASYVFRHELIRDAAYQSLLRSARREHHRRVARALTDRFPAVVEQRPALLAQHLSDGGEADRAIEWWRRAEEAAERRGAHEEGIAHLREALGLLSGIDPEKRGPTEFTLQASLARLLSAARGWGHDETVEALRRARELSEHEADPTRRAAIFYESSSAAVAQGQHAGSLEWYAKVLEIGRAAGDPGLQGAARLGMAISHFYQGRFSESLDHLDRVAQLFGRDHQLPARFAAEDLHVALAVWEGWICWFRGLPDRSIAGADRAVALARSSNDSFSLAFALSFGSTVAIQMRLPDRAQVFAEEGARLASELGFPLHEALAMMLLGLVRAARGDAGGFEQHAAGMSRLATTGNLGGASMTLELLVSAQVGMGLMPAAGQTLDLAAALIVPGEGCCDAELLRLRGELLLGADPPDSESVESAEAMFRKALVLARDQGAASFALRAAMSLAQLLARGGRREEAASVLRPIHAEFTEGFDTPDLLDAEGLLAEIES